MTRSKPATALLLLVSALSLFALGRVVLGVAANAMGGSQASAPLWAGAALMLPAAAIGYVTLDAPDRYAAAGVGVLGTALMIALLGAMAGLLWASAGGLDRAALMQRGAGYGSLVAAAVGVLAMVRAGKRVGA